MMSKRGSGKLKKKRFSTKEIKRTSFHEHLSMNNGGTMSVAINVLFRAGGKYS